jgi:putative DNA primase/helicase
MQKKFSDSDIVRHTREQYEMESDSVRLFMDELGYKPSSESFTSIKILYQEYRAFCQDDGLRPINKTGFSKRLENCNIVIEKKNIGKVAFIEN